MWVVPPAGPRGRRCPTSSASHAATTISARTRWMRITIPRSPSAAMVAPATARRGLNAERPPRRSAEPDHLPPVRSDLHELALTAEGREQGVHPRRRDVLRAGLGLQFLQAEAAGLLLEPAHQPLE